MVLARDKVILPKPCIECHMKSLDIAKEVGTKVGEGLAYGNLGNFYHNLADFKLAIEYHQRDLNIAKQLVTNLG